MQADFFTNILLPVGLGVLMLGMGLGLILADFQRITRYPKAVLIGLVNQIIILPIVGFIIVSLLPLRPEIAVGLMIVAICPSGPSSNVLTYLAKGDVALSVTLTAFSSIITIFTIPFLASLTLQHFMGESAAISLPIGSTMGQIFLIIVLPLVMGMTIRHYFPLLAKSLEPITNRLAVIFLAVIIFLLILREWQRLPLFIAQTGIAVIILNTIASLIGFFSGLLFQLTIPQRICIAIEVGIQSGTLAIGITAGLLKNPDLAIPAMVYSLWMYVSAFIAVYYGRKKAALVK
ncbi:pantothenate precursors transporter PanS [Microcystis aeruginosa NIES-2520]|jgi:BASS family bile acid:Na+ symporter|uniref:Pantothenates transporter PanS n=1 Tax=Microcystis aeruginosa NIES-2520 TaxID=2303982 RepID=A0A5A5RUD3_MICAE|nr:MULTISPECIES: bile acid:sodium symporter family protein [Microcystis]NCR77702.1 bile acid:sodium symporter family protein [Microcystis aeruginosa K13-06]MCA2666486.1 bile acid:sodium symporter family protein [Microcystis sp. M045S2]MCA2715073.1 bile acid:sodium symporter family protein [Microcystis sp. M172S2]MCA2804234.1 bile acid:sodium symporter family protein [Microcystis sp. M114S2]MCA2834971.1 bile acid:sodium symporter family protein [Microcystis sp. M007S1]